MKSIETYLENIMHCGGWCILCSSFLSFLFGIVTFDWLFIGIGIFYFFIATFVINGTIYTR